MAKRKRVMSSKKMMAKTCGAGGCSSCKSWGWILALVGAIYLLMDLGLLSMWGLNWPLNWWTVAFLIMGLKGLMSSR